MKKEMTYMDSVHRDGRIWNLSVMAILIAFPIAVAMIFNAAPDWKGFFIGLVSTAPMYWAVAVVETFTFVPMLGAGGSYLSFVTGNISNLKLPVAISALEQAGVNPDNITVSEDCPSCQNEKYWSHRKTGNNRGSMAAVIQLL